ncbi:uncharacterized protein CcaverHIS019_0500850 [Cutaneotrichosporon cavernicola]|uniref:Uncharacterized protein n=1 Tax=Cutaneotrichosporon cavernicola TaxID=279322 RepID=A0AA48L5Q7_9TREE|nr:uncharacterized protein CcaverHIS019_0500850 [Cutaneotrichosporon cavernicola]BEI92457.1 hypothetical protein CcaverHIS019_0500850 [Cutaneotrichosporon cavernicola]
MPPVDPTAHVMDYPALDLGHKHASRTTLALVDLDVHIWGLDEIAGSNLPVGVVILGRVAQLDMVSRSSMISSLTVLPAHLSPIKQGIACNAFPGLQKIRHTASMLLSDFDGTSAPPGDADEASRRSL